MLHELGNKKKIVELQTGPLGSTIKKVILTCLVTILT